MAVWRQCSVWWRHALRPDSMATECHIICSILSATAESSTGCFVLQLRSMSKYGTKILTAQSTRRCSNDATTG